MLQGKEETAQFTKQLLSSAAYWIMIAMFQMAFYGVLYGVFIAYFVRRRLAAIKDYQDNDSQETENNSDETIQ
jgi:preprotein translocase subunit Sec63